MKGRVMRDRFRAKTWILWAQLLVFGPAGVVLLVMGILMWIGVVRKPDGELQREAGPPATISGVVALVFVAMIATNLAARRRPIIRCYREGIECVFAGG